MATANLGLTESTVGVDSGADAASREQTNIDLIDLHDHTSGKGVRIPTGGLNINADLPFNNNSLTEAESIQFESQASNVLVANTIFVKNNELFYVDGSLNVVQLTSGGAVSVTTLASGSVLLDAGNARGANLRFGTNDSYSAIIETNNTDRFTINSSGFAQVLNDFGIAKGGAVSSTGTLNDVSTSAKSYFAFTGGASTTVTGFANGSDGKLLYILNKTGTQLTINNNDSGSVAANRILTGTGAAISIENNASLVLIYDTTTSLWNVVGGTGGGSAGAPVYTINLAGGTLYNDSAAAPVDGTGGTTTGMTYAAVTSGTLRGAVSYRLSKDAANRQGNGVAFDLTIDSVDKSTVQSINFDISASANFVSGDASLYIYDVTNAVMLPIVTVLPTGTSAQFSRAIALTTGTSYRILLHVASTSALAYDITLDAMTVNSIIRPQAPAISDWVSYTPTLSAAFGSATNIAGRYKREGDNVRIIASFTNGTAAASIASISLPTGLTIDSGKLTFNNTTSTEGNILGWWNRNTGAASMGGHIVSAPSTSTSVVYFSNQISSAVNHLLPANGNAISVGTEVFSLEALVPIANWSSNVTLSSTNGSIEYASNSSATDADDTTSFVDGAAGSVGILGVTALTTRRKKRIRFKTPIQPTDRIQIEILVNNIWIPAIGAEVPASTARYLQNHVEGSSASDTAGVALAVVSGSSTDLDVVFARWFWINLTTVTSQAWNTITAGTRWRVAKYSSIGAAELAPATASSQGTVGYSQWTTYTPTFSAGFGTPTSIAAKWKRTGDTLEVRGKFNTGTCAASLGTISLPSVNGVQLTIDTTKMITTVASGSAGEEVGTLMRITSTTIPLRVTITAHTSTATDVVYTCNNGSSATPTLPTNVSTVLGNTESQVFYFSVPVSQWS